MTLQEKELIRYLRLEGMSYSVIADRLELPESSVKNECRRSGLSGNADKVVDSVCRQCGQLLEHHETRKPRATPHNTKASKTDRMET